MFGNVANEKRCKVFKSSYREKNNKTDCSLQLNFRLIFPIRVPFSCILFLIFSYFAIQDDV